VKVESALLLGPTRRKRRAFAAERCKTSIAIIEQRFVVSEPTATE
jgi:hypothetical protein